MKYISIFILLISLVSCYSPSPKVQKILRGEVSGHPVSVALAGEYPDNYKEIIKDTINKSFFDPYSLRNVSISQPSPGTVIAEDGYVVCLESNGKNRYGAYTGLTQIAFIIRHGRVVDSTSSKFGWVVCSDKTFNFKFEPWPEMEMIGNKQNQ